MAYSMIVFSVAAFILSRAVTASPQAATITSTVLPTATAVVPGLNYLARTAGKLYFGTATDVDELNDTTYTHITENYAHFGQITPENSMKWEYTEPEPGVFTFEDGDIIANLAHSNGMLLRGHNCVWYEELPGWVTANNYNASELAFVVASHCGTLVGHYKGQVWDVINEPLNDNGLHERQIRMPSYINDYNTEYVGVKSTALQNLIKQLQTSGVPIDGVGFESHFIVGEVPTTLVKTFQAYAALGLEFAITELDIRMEFLPTAEKLEQQKTDFYTVVSACMAVPQCVGVTVWDWTDKYSWIPSAFPGYGAACPWSSETSVRWNCHRLWEWCNLT